MSAPEVMLQDNAKPLLKGWVLNGQGGARAINYQQLATLELQADEKLWLHWNKEHPSTLAWLKASQSISRFERQLLLEKTTRPRFLALTEHTLLLFSRVIQPKARADSSELFSVRVRCTEQVVLSFAQPGAVFGDGLKQLFKEKLGPKTTAELLLLLMREATEQIDHAVEALAEFVDQQELRVDQEEKYEPDHQELLQIRRSSANLRRYLAPMKDLFAALAKAQPAWFDKGTRPYWNEISNMLIRCLEELELCKERVGFILDSERRKREQRTGRVMYLLAVVTAFFLPLSFVTGLLGINVGGIPGSDAGHGFLIACLIITGLAAIQFMILRVLRWL